MSKAILAPLAGVLALAAVAMGAAAALAGGAPVLTGAEWRIEDIAGGGVIDRSPATLEFLEDGALAGNASCNRFFGTFRQDEDGAISLMPAGLTRMACVEALMRQEQKLLDLLPRIERAALDNTGALILTATDGRRILARR